MRLTFALAGALLLASSSGCRILTQTVACESARDCDDGEQCLDGLCVNPCLDPLADGCDADGDGTLNEDDPDPRDACDPVIDVLACKGGDEDNDGTQNGDDDDDGDACVPIEDNARCDRGDQDGDGTQNGDEVAAELDDPCRPDANAAACAVADFDDDGTDKPADPDDDDPCVPSDRAEPCEQDPDGDRLNNPDDDDNDDPCVPDPADPVCPTADNDGDGVDNANDVAANDPCRPSDLAETCDADPDLDLVDNVNDPDNADPLSRLNTFLTLPAQHLPDTSSSEVRDELGSERCRGVQEQLCSGVRCARRKSGRGVSKI